jgi:hypothetical protein
MLEASPIVTVPKTQRTTTHNTAWLSNDEWIGASSLLLGKM